MANEDDLGKSIQTASLHKGWTYIQHDIDIEMSANNLSIV